MIPNRIILVRHGQSESNVDALKYESIPDFAFHLTDEGVKQATEAGKTIQEIVGEETVHAYLSPYFRTRQTFEHIRKCIEPNVVKAFEDPRLREQDWGHLRHPDVTEVINEERYKYSTFYFRFPDGESGADVYDRVSAFLETLYRDFARPDYPQNTLIVSHGITMRLFLMRWYHWSVEEFEDLRNPKNCQIVVMQRDEMNRYQLMSKLAKRSEEA